MAKKSRNNNVSSFKRFSSKFSKQAVMAIIFVLVFGALGGYIVGKGRAATPPCVLQTFTTADEASSLRCVVDAQVLLNDVNKEINHAWGAQLSTDGQYGPLTAARVKQFQSANGLSRDGELGYHTWTALCLNVGNNLGTGGPYFRNADCQYFFDV